MVLTSWEQQADHWHVDQTLSWQSSQKAIKNGTSLSTLQAKDSSIVGTVVHAQLLWVAELLDSCAISHTNQKVDSTLGPEHASEHPCQARPQGAHDLSLTRKCRNCRKVMVCHGKSSFKFALKKILWFQNLFINLLFIDHSWTVPEGSFAIYDPDSPPMLI